MKETIQTAKQPINAKVMIPGSKSITNRAFLLAALANGVSEISNILLSDDTRAFLQALHELGIVVQLDEEAQSCIIAGGSGQFPNKKTSIWCADAGTVLRFLLPACAMTPGSFYFDGSKQLRMRPIEPLLRALLTQGAAIIPQDAMQLPFTIQGAESLPGGEIEVDGSESGQFVSALLMVAPFAQRAVIIKTEALVSRPFVYMTCAMMAEFGVLVRRLHQYRFSVPVPQRYVARDYVVEPDLTTASYFFAAAAVTAGQVMIQPLIINTSKQGDAKFLTVLEKMGCEIKETARGLLVKGPEQLKGVSVDMRDCSDVFMTLAAIAPFASTPTTITNIGHTRLQESNRISVMREELEKLAVKVEEGPDWIKVYPSTPKGGIVDAHNDHRIAMSFALIGLKVPGIEIDGAECVAKTCPQFFTLWASLYG